MEISGERMSFEYKVVPAPVKGVKARGVKAGPDRFAHALEIVMNDLAADGWEYQRTDTLPCEEREGLMGKTTVYQNMLVFRRASIVDVQEERLPIEEAKALPAPAPEAAADAEPNTAENEPADLDTDDAPDPARVAAE